jgi:hypothetical protein
MAEWHRLESSDADFNAGQSMNDMLANLEEPPVPDESDEHIRKIAGSPSEGEMVFHWQMSALPADQVLGDSPQSWTIMPRELQRQVERFMAEFHAQKGTLAFRLASAPDDERRAVAMKRLEEHIEKCTRACLFNRRTHLPLMSNHAAAKLKLWAETGVMGDKNTLIMRCHLTALRVSIDNGPDHLFRCVKLPSHLTSNTLLVQRVIDWRMDGYDSDEALKLVLSGLGGAFTPYA